MPSAPLNNVTAPDTADKTSTLDPGLFLDHVNIDVVDQGIYWQAKQATRRGSSPGMASWQAEVYMNPGSRTIARPALTGFRFRAATPAASLPANTVQAVVTVEGVYN